MSFATRLKKLTDYLYSPTNPASEDAIREDIDDSIQEVYDNVQTAMADTGGAGLVGYDGGYATVKSALEAFESGGSGTIPPDDSITLAKQNSTVKTGLLANLVTTIKTNLVNAINEDVVNLDITRIAELDTGAADAYVVTTAGTFSRVDGNILPFIPANANTGASTINEDGNGVADIKKWVEGVSTALEEGDLPKFQKAELVWNSSETDFFFAPKGGGGLDFKGTYGYFNDTAIATQTLRKTIVGAGWLLDLSNVDTSAIISGNFSIDGGGEEDFIVRLGACIGLMLRYETGFTASADDASIGGAYLEDDGSGKIEKASLKLWGGSTANITTLKHTVVGSGTLTGLRTQQVAFPYSFLRLVVDGVETSSEASNGLHVSDHILNKRFETGFSVYSNEGFASVSWNDD